MAVLTTLRQLFSRGLEATANFLLGRRVSGAAATAAINQRLAPSGDTATPQIVGTLLSRVRQANAAAVQRELTTNPAGVNPPAAPGMNFTDPMTGEVTASRTLIIIDWQSEGVHHDMGVVVYHDVNTTWEEMKRKAVDAALEAQARHVNTPSVQEALRRGDANISFKSYQNYQRE